jgi:hypothetical protein
VAGRRPGRRVVMGSAPARLLGPKRPCLPAAAMLLRCSRTSAHGASPAWPPCTAQPSPQPPPPPLPAGLPGRQRAVERPELSPHQRRLCCDQRQGEEGSGRLHDCRRAACLPALDPC